MADVVGSIGDPLSDHTAPISWPEGLLADRSVGSDQERTSLSAVEAPRRPVRLIHRSYQGQSKLGRTHTYWAADRLTEPGLYVCE